MIVWTFYFWWNIHHIFILEQNVYQVLLAGHVHNLRCKNQARWDICHLKEVTGQCGLRHPHRFCKQPICCPSGYSWVDWRPNSNSDAQTGPSVSWRRNNRCECKHGDDLTKKSVEVSESCLQSNVHCQISSDRNRFSTTGNYRDEKMSLFTPPCCG